MDAPRPPSLLLRLIARRSVLLSMVVLVRPGCVHALSVRRKAVADGGLAGGAGVPVAGHRVGCRGRLRATAGRIADAPDRRHDGLPGHPDAPGALLKTTRKIHNSV